MMGQDGRRQVFVFTHPGKRGPKFSAYTMWASASWSGCCTHLVAAPSGTEAKKRAIREHRENCGPLLARVLEGR